MAGCRPTEAQKQEVEDLRSAYKKLVSGARVASARDSNGERIEYSAGNIDGLRTLIKELEFQYGMSSTGRPIRTVM